VSENNARAAAERSPIGVIGLGNIGFPMAVRLQRRFDVLAYDIAESARGAATSVGLSVTASVEHLARQCRAVVVMVPDDAAVRDVVLGRADAAGLIGSMADGSLIVISATTAPTTCRQLGVAAADAGLALVDAPVSGGAIGARSGNLIAMVGGDEESFLRCRDALEPLASAVVHVGSLGAGQTMKLLNNFVALATLNATKEALHFATLLGIDREVFRAVGQRATADCWALRHWPEHLAANRGHRSLGRKDLGLLRAVLEERSTASELIPVLIAMSDRLYEDADSI
jgi:3-hydroxyisobutyrate dehydrogenase-like beta-hydroxyacid dehydrogenase